MAKHYMRKRGVAMRVNESICSLRQRSTWRPTLKRVPSGTSISVFLNGEWTEKNVRNMARICQTWPRDIDKLAEFDTVAIDECETNHVIEDICLDTRPISYKDSWQHEREKDE